MSGDIHIEKLRRFCHDCTFLKMNPKAITGMAAIIGFDPRASNPDRGAIKTEHPVITPDRMLITKYMLFNGGQRPSSE